MQELFKATKDVFTFPKSKDGGAMMLPEQTSRVVLLGTGLICTAGDCVTEARLLIEQIGDFELEELFVSGRAVLQSAQDREHSPPKGDQRLERTASRSMTSFEKRLSKKILPSLRGVVLSVTETSDRRDFAQPFPVITTDANYQGTPLSADALKTLATPSMCRQSAIRKSHNVIIGIALRSPLSQQAASVGPDRKNSVGLSAAGSTEAHRSGIRDSGISTLSEVSTRATTPDRPKAPIIPDRLFLTVSPARPKTFASELTFNKEGQVTGGSLPALVEQLTTCDSAPDSQFSSAFYLTFRMFTTPRDFAVALISRFDYVGDSKAVGTPVRLRIYNVFKGWLETYWNAEADKNALGDIRCFALHKLKPHLCSAGERLLELTRKVNTVYHINSMNGPLLFGVGKDSMSIAATHIGTPEPLVTKGQLQAIRASAQNGSNCNVLDVDPTELAHQLTPKTLKIICEIQPSELLSLEWGEHDTEKARNGRAMCTINTDLAHVVGHTILMPDDAKKRAMVLKHWSKVGARCLELNNYDSLITIMCSINSSVLRFERGFGTHVSPCIPFLGVYLTDLTFLDAGNPKTRELPDAAAGDSRTVSVINFDKHMRKAKIISHLQKFQVRYKLRNVPEMQAWMEANMARMRVSNDQMVGNFHRRSLPVELKQEDSKASKAVDGKRVNVGSGDDRPKTGSKNRLETLLKGSSFSMKTLGLQDDCVDRVTFGEAVLWR
ncbi:Ras guanine nucleotide exchange factor bud5 [Friedmanniomyces endolithicus]|nr:Ras guanine nucleotide exchange factor bud5 [Friedmanniomyces endolithicus]